MLQKKADPQRIHENSPGIDTSSTEYSGRELVGIISLGTRTRYSTGVTGYLSVESENHV